MSQSTRVCDLDTLSAMHCGTSSTIFCILLRDRKQQFLSFYIPFVYHLCKYNSLGHWTFVLSHVLVTYTNISCTEHSMSSKIWDPGALLKCKALLKYSSLSGLDMLSMMNEPAITWRGPLYSKVQQQQQRIREFTWEREENCVMAKLECQLSVLTGLLNLEIKQNKET